MSCFTNMTANQLSVVQYDGGPMLSQSRGNTERDTQSVSCGAGRSDLFTRHRANTGSEEERAGRGRGLMVSYVIDGLTRRFASCRAGAACSDKVCCFVLGATITSGKNNNQNKQTNTQKKLVR